MVRLWMAWRNSFRMSLVSSGSCACQGLSPSLCPWGCWDSVGDIAVRAALVCIALVGEPSMWVLRDSTSPAVAARSRSAKSRLSACISGDTREWLLAAPSTIGIWSHAWNPPATLPCAAVVSGVEPSAGVVGPLGSVDDRNGSIVGTATTRLGEVLLVRLLCPKVLHPCCWCSSVALGDGFLSSGSSWDVFWVWAPSDCLGSSGASPSIPRLPVSVVGPLLVDWLGHRKRRSPVDGEVGCSVRVEAIAWPSLSSCPPWHPGPAVWRPVGLPPHGPFLVWDAWSVVPLLGLFGNGWPLEGEDPAPWRMPEGPCRSDPGLASSRPSSGSSSCAAWCTTGQFEAKWICSAMKRSGINALAGSVGKLTGCPQKLHVVSWSCKPNMLVTIWNLIWAAHWLWSRCCCQWCTTSAAGWCCRPHWMHQLLRKPARPGCCHKSSNCLVYSVSCIVLYMGNWSMCWSHTWSLSGINCVGTSVSCWLSMKIMENWRSNVHTCVRPCSWQLGLHWHPCLAWTAWMRNLSVSCEACQSWLCACWRCAPRSFCLP